MKMPRKFNASPQKVQAFSLAIALLLLGVALYAPSLAFDFTYDDVLTIKQSTYVNNPAFSVQSILDAFSEPYRPGTLYRPVAMISYRLNFLFFGSAPDSFHAINILLHLVGTLLVLKFLELFLQSTSAAFIGGAVFLLHPVHVETVSNIVGRAEQLSLCFGLSALLLFYAEATPLGQWRVPKVIFATLLFWAAALSKESGLIFTALIPAALFALGRPSRYIIQVVIALGISSASILAIRSAVLGNDFIVRYPPGTFVAANPLINEPFTTRALPAVEQLGQYLTMLFWPAHLSADYSSAAPEFWANVISPSGLLKIIPVTPLLVLSIAMRRRRWGFLGFWFFIAFALTCNILTPIGTIAGERLLYLPSVGAIGFSVGLLFEVLSRGRTTNFFHYALGLGVLGLLFVRASQRVPVWRDNGTVFAQTIVDAPLSPKAAFNYGLWLYQNEGKIEESEGYFRRAFELVPTNVESAIFLLNISLHKSDLARAHFWARKASELDPSNMQVREKLEQLEKAR